MQFFAWGINRPGAGEARSAIINDHWDFIDRYDDTLIARGPVLDDADPGQVIGSIHVLDLADWDAAREFAYREPFAGAGLFSDIVLKRFRLDMDRTQFQFRGNPDHPRFFIHCPAGGGNPGALADDHHAYCREFDAHMICRGALLTAEGDWDGAVFFAEFPDADAVRAFLEGEPLNRAGLFKAPAIRRWTMGGRANLNAKGTLK